MSFATASGQTIYYRVDGPDSNVPVATASSTGSDQAIVHPRSGRSMRRPCRLGTLMATPPGQVKTLACAMQDMSFVEIPDAGHPSRIEQPDATTLSILESLDDVG